MKGNNTTFHKTQNLTTSPGPMDKSDKGKLTIGGHMFTSSGTRMKYISLKSSRHFLFKNIKSDGVGWADKEI